MNFRLPTATSRRVILICGLAMLWIMAFTTVASADMMNFAYTFTGTESLQGPDRLFRDGVPSTAPTSKPFPGTFPNNPTYFVTFAIDALPGSVLSVTSTSQDNDTFLSLYLDVFNPANLASNYLGDEGTSQAAITFSILVPGSGHILLVGNTDFDGHSIGHSFAATATFIPAGAVPDESSTALLLFVALAAIAGLHNKLASRLRSSSPA